MKRIIGWSGLLTALLLVTQAFGITATVTVKDSAGNALSGVAISYKGPSTQNVGYPLGTTDGNGIATMELAAGSYAFHARYAQTDSGWTPLQDISDDPSAEFQTSAITVEVKSCAGLPISGASIEYKGTSSQNVFYTLGTTGVGGTISKELFPATYTFRGTYNKTRLAPAYHVTQDVVANPLVKLATTKVTLNYAGTIYYNGVDANPIWPFSKPSMEMFAGPNTFKFNYTGGSILMPTEVSGCEFGGQFAVIKLVDSTGAGLAGGVASHRSQGGGNDIVIGTTDASGVVAALLPNYVTKVSMDWDPSLVNNWTRRETKDLGPVPLVFQTVKAEVRFETCAGIGHAGVDISFKPRSTMQLFGTTDANGVASREIFAGAYDLQINNFNWARSELIAGHVFPGLATFKTTKVTINYPNTVQYKHPAYSGSWRAYSKPMELLPGSYTFRFKTGPGNNDWSGGLPMTVAGCDTGGTIAVIKLLDSYGNGLAGGTAHWYRNSSPAGWISIPGSTDANGILVALVGASAPNIRLAYNCTQGWEQHNLNTDPNVVFQTGRVLSASGTCTYWQSTMGGPCPVWVPFADNVELLPGARQFKGTENAMGWWEYFTIAGGTANVIR